MKIHISESTKNYLDAAGGFQIEERGDTEIKVICNTNKPQFPRQ